MTTPEPPEPIRRWTLTVNGEEVTGPCLVRRNAAGKTVKVDITDPELVADLESFFAGLWRKPTTSPVTTRIWWVKAGEEGTT